jgi:hypothetical protein
MPYYTIKSKNGSIVTPNANGEPQKFMRVVKAKNAAQAVAHVVADMLSVEKAQADDYMQLASSGGKIEEAVADGG